MHAILDTNILYYWSGIQPSKFDPIRISKERLGFESFLLPLWSLIEVVTSTELTTDQKRRIFEFVGQERIGIHGITMDLSKLIPSDILERFRSGVIGEVVAEAAKFKFETERGLLVFLVESCVAVLAIFYDAELKLDTAEKRHKFTKQIESLILGNRPFITDQVDLILKTFYATDDGAKMREDIESLVYSLFYVASMNFAFAGVNHFVVPNVEETLDDVEREELRSNLANNAFLKKIRKKLNTEVCRNLVKEKSHGRSLDGALASFEKEMRITFSSGLTKYYSVLIKKLLTDGTRIEKNDIIDSFLMNYYPAFVVLTAEKRIRTIIKEIDEPYSRHNEAFIGRISIESDASPESGA